MKRIRRIAVGTVAWLALGLAASVAVAQPFGMGPSVMHGMGPAMMHGMDQETGAGSHGSMAGATAMLTKQDAGSAADMGLVHDLVMNHARIRRSVTNLPNGIRTVTESDDPQVALAIKAHVASMSQRLKDGREFNLFSTTLPVLFEKRDRIQSVVEVTEKGTIVTRTSADARVVAALQGHAAEVTELAQEGPAAMMRGMMSRMAMGFRGAASGAGGAARPDAPGQPALRNNQP